MAKNQLLRPWEHPALAGQLRLRLVLALVVALSSTATLLAGATLLGRSDDQAAFLTDALGAADASAPLVRTPAPGVHVRIQPGGYSVAGPAGTVGLRAVQQGGALVRHDNGVSQTTDFGSAAVVVDDERTEQFLTVTRRQGKHTWRWQLDTSLVPRVGNDGAVVFLSDSSRRVAGPVLAPVQVLDAGGRDVTPEGARWSTGLNHKGWELRLTIDDSELPLPYVIDPAVVHRATTVSNNGAAGAANVSLTYPAGVAANDLLIATIAVRQNTTVATPVGWAAGQASQNGTNVRLFTFYKVATASEPASQSFTWTGTRQAVGAISAYYGIKASLGNASILDVMGAAATGNTATASATSITTLTANALLVASFAIDNDGTFGAVTGMTERWDATSASATTASRASGAQSDSTQVVAAATGNKTSALGGTRNWAAHLHSFEVDNVNPTITPTIPSLIRGTFTLTSTVSDADSGVRSVLYEGSPAGAGTWSTLGTSSSSPWSLPFDTTLAGDGFYDVRITVTDWAGNTATATASTIRVDNSSPDQNPLTLTPLTGTANQYWDSANSVHYYNPTSAGTFSLSSVPRDVSPPISFVGGNGGANNNSPLTLNVPAGVQAGDLLIAQVGYERTMATSVPTPAGWTRHVDRDNGTIYGQVIFYRWATASEPASYTIPHASGAASISGTLLAYRGVASVSPVLVNNGTVATGTTLTAPSITTTAGCGRLVAFYGLWNTATLSTPAGMTQRATAINTEVDWNSRVLAADESLGAAGATGTRVSTATVTDPNGTGPGSNVSELVALRPLACVSSVQYPTPGQTGFTGGGNTDTVEPYAASPDYSFGPTNTVSPGARTIVVSDEAGNPVLNQTITFTRDVAAPVTTDDTGTITNAWRNVDTTVTLSPSDGTGAGLVQTYYTTNGVNPTTGSPTGTSILLTAEGTYTIKYFSTDRVANTEAVKTGAAQIRIDKTNPTSATLTALPAAIRNGQSLTGGGADALSGVGSITYLYCAGAACTPSTVVGSSSTPAGGYPVTWNSQPADGTYRVRARVFDAAGNQLDSAIQTVTIDNTNPTGAVTAPAAAANVRGSSVSVTSNSADGGSGVANALFQRSPAGAGTWTTIGAADTSTPYAVTWDTTAVTDGLYDLRVITTDNAGNTFTSTTITNVRVDNTNPTGAVTAPTAAANVRGTSVSVTANSADGGSGVANALFQRSPAGAGTWTTIGAADTSTPYAVTWDTTAVTDGLYDLRVITTDNAGNTFTSTTIANVRVDNTVPTQTLALTGVAPAGSAYLSGTNLFYRGAAAGQLRVRNTVADGGSGPASSTTSALGGTSTGWTHTAGTISTPAGGPYDSNLLSWSAGTTTSPTVDLYATDAAGNNSATATLTLRNDTTAPTGGALTVNGVAASAGGTTSNSNGSFTIGVRTDWTETASPTASGLASSTLTRDSAAYTNNACGLYSGSPTTIVGTPAQNLTVGCYRYVLTGTDNVGNVVSIQTDVLVHGAATQIVLTGSTANLTSGATRVLTATIQDANGNTVTSDNSTVVTYGKQSGAGTVTGTGTATATAGVATKTITGALAGSVTMEATAGGLTTGTLGAFTVVHGAAAQIALSGSTANLASGATRVLTATIQDAAGNTVTADSTTVVTFAKQSGAGTVTGTGTATAASGVATKTITGALVGPVVMQATAAGLTTGTLGSFTVVHGAAAQIVLSGATTNLTSGATRVLTATIQDAAGNTVTADNTTVVTFGKQSGAGTVTGTGTATAAAGVANRTITGALVGSVVMEATAAGLTTGTLGSFTVVHGAAADIALTGATTNLTSGTTRVLTATIRDAAGNTVTGDSTTVVTFGKQSGAGTVTGTGTATAASGVATKTITGALVGPVVMEATALGLTTGTLGSFTVVHGAAAQIALSGAITNLTSGAARVLTATIQDAAGNTVSADNTTVITFGKQSGAGTVTGAGTATAAAGVATKTITGALVGPVVMEATAAGLTTGTLGSFTVVHGAAAQIALSGSTANLTSGATRVLTGTIQDAAGNTVTSDNTTVVSFGKQSGAGTVTGTGTATATAGVATKTITGQLVGPVVMQATATGLTTGTLGSFTVVHGAAVDIALTGSTANLTSGATRVLTATLRDAAGNTVTSDSTTVVTFGKQSGAGTVTGTGNATAASGVATKTITGVLVGSVTMEATAAGLTTGTLGAFTVVHGAAAQIALSGATTNLTSGSTRVLTATIQDAAGNTVTSDNSTVITFGKQSGAGTVTGTGNATAASGVATKTITGALVGSVTMEATAIGLTTGTLGAFTVVHGAAAQIALSGATTNLTSGATRVLTATIQDAAGNTVTADSSTVVNFGKQSGAGSVTGTGTATAVAGVATKTVAGALVGSVVMEATAAGLTTGTLGSFTVVHGAAGQIALTGSTTNLTSGATRLLTATIQDAAGNTVTADSSTVITFGKQSGAGTVTGTGNATAASGVATKTITGALVGSVTMEATAAGLTTGTLGAFIVVHGAAADIALSGSTANLTSGATRVLTATIRDAAGNTVTSDSSTVITFGKQSGAGTVTGTGNATAASGVATKTITGALVGSVTMEATSIGLTTGTLGAFTVVHGAAADIALTGATTNLTSGATRVLTATIKDAAGNTVTGDNTTVITFAKASGAGTISGTGTATAAAGVATKTVTGALVGSVTMEATALGLTTGTLGSFTVVHGPAAQVALTGSTTNLTSGATRVLTATIQDAAGNTVTGDNTTVITFAKQSGAGTVTGTGTATAASGVATKTITGALVGSVTMEATAAGLITGSLGTFTVVHGGAAQIMLSGSTANLTSGATRVLTATIQDAAGNTVTGDNTTVVTFGKQSGAGTVTGTGTATAASGVATKTITGALVGSVTMEGTSIGLTTGTLGAFTVVHGAASQIVLTGSTTNLVSGAARVLTATIQDAAGNTVTADNSTVLTFAKQSGAGTVTGTGAATATGGVATKTITGQLIGSVTMEATAAGLATGSLGAFTVVHGAASQIALTGATTNLVSGATRVLTATLQDAAGNTVTSDNSTVITFAKQSGSGTVTGAGTATATSGVATKTITGQLVGSVTMEATAAGLTTGALGAFTVVHGPAADIVLSGSTANLTSGATRVLSATIRDAAGNTVTADNTTVIAFAKASGAGTVTGTGNATAVAGVATKTVTGALVGPVVMEATALGLTTGTLGSFTVVHGAAAQVALTGSTTNLTSGATRLLTATIQDAAGNTVTSDNTAVVTFAKQSGAGTVTGTGNATAAAGVATKTITGALVGTVTMEATAAGLTTGTLGPFTVVHGAAADISLTGSTTNLTSGATRVLTATIRDAAGNTVTGDNTTVITFAKASGAGTVTGTGTATAAAGVATKTITGALVGSATMEATALGLITGTLGAFTVVHGAAADIAISGSIANLTSGATRVFTATIRDAAGNTVTGDSTTVVTFAKASGAGTVTGAGNATAAAGVATKTITGALIGPVVMEATATGLTTGTLGSFTVVHGAASQIGLTGSTANLTSGATRVLTATIQDAAGNTVTADNSTEIAFAKQSGAGSVTGTGNATATAGVATKTITGDLVGPVTMEATAAGLTTGTLGSFTVVHGAAAQIALSGAITNLVSGATRVLTATIQDAAGNTVTSDSTTVITFAKQSGAGTVTGTGTATATSGVATKTITGALAGSVTMEAAAAGLTTGNLGAFTVVHGAAAQIALSGSTADLTSGATRVLTATIQDAAGNTVTADSSTVVTFAKASGTGTVTGTGTATAAAGVATKTVTGQLVGAVTMEATAAGLTTGTLGAFTVVHGAAAQIALAGATTNLVSGAARVLTATIQDAAGNTVTGDSTTVVTFAKQSGAGTVTGTGTATAASGVATKTITGDLVGTVTMEATAAGLTTGTLGAFTVVHGAAADVVLTGSTANLVSGATRVLTATIKDAAGNTVASDNSTVISFAQASGSGSVTGVGTATATNGVATKTVTGALVGTVTMEATAAGLTTGTLGAFTVVHGAAVQVALSGATGDLSSGATRFLTATVQDAAGNTITSDNSTAVTFAQASGAGTVTGLAGAEVVAGGIATKTVTGDLAGSVGLEATAAGLTVGTLSFDVVHGAAYKVTVSASPTDLVSGTTRVITATVRDAAGNRVASDNSTVVTFAKASGAGTVTGLGTDTAAAGVAAKTVTGQLAGTITMLGSAPGLVSDNVSFDVVHGAAATIDLSGSTSDLASGATRVLTATIKDAAGNTVTSDNSTVLTFAKQSGAGTVTGTGTATAAGGMATKTITGQLVGSVAMEATAAGLTTGTLGAFTVVHGAASQIVLTGATTDLVSGATRVLTATLQDGAGNTVTADNSTVLTFAKQSGAGTVTGTGTATVTAGVATKTITGQLVGSVTMETTAAGLTTGILGPFTVVHGAASQIALTHSGSTASGDNHTLTATIQDAAGNTVTSDNSTVVAFAKTGGPGTVTGLANATASNGVATRVVVNATSGQIDLDAQAAGLASGNTTYVVTAGSASTLTSTMAASPTSIVADGASTSTITVRLKDVAGNDLNGTGGTVALALTGTGSLSAVTDNGDGTYTATLTSPTTVGGATVTGTLNGSALAASTGVTYVHGPAAKIVLTESGSTVAGNAHTLTATIQDAHGNTVTSDSATVVAFAKTGGAGTVAGLGNATASNGVATRVVTNKLAGPINLDAQVAGLTTGTSSYTIVTGPVSAAASDSTVVAVPAAVYANGADTATITVTLRDAGGNGIAGKTVTLAQGGGGSTITGGGATNASGVVTFSASDATVETVTYTATDTTDSIALTDDATVDFTFSDATPPTNAITLGTANRALLTGTTLYYNGAAGGSFTLSSAVSDGGAGPLSATYPVVARAGWTHGAETVSTPAGGPYASGAFTFGAGTSGDFTYDVTANDAWTPTNSSVTTLNVTEDSTAPAASILCNGAACAAGWYTASPVTVALAAPDAGAGLDQIRYTTDGTDPTILTGNVFAGGFTVAAEGVTTVKYRAFDEIGNDSGVLAQTVRIDTIAPDTTLDSTPAAATQDTTPTFAFSSPEPGTAFQTRLNGGSWTSATSPLTLGPLAENTYTFEVRATDVAGNVDASPASFIFTVDTTSANTTITSSPPADSNSTSASFSFTASDAGPGFECRLDGGAFADCSSPVSYTGLTEAAHTFEVRAKDAAGNLDATPATHAWTVDLTAPNTSLLSTPAHPSPDSTPTFSLGSTESPATFECDLDGGGWAPCTTPFTTPTLADGSHTLKVRASDAAGNTDASEVTFTWLVDATDPTGSITSPADGADVSGTIMLVSNSTDGGSGVASVVFQRSPVGAGTWTNQAASWDTTAQADGDYDLRAITTDSAGNSVTSPVITVTVDNTDPTLSVSAPNPVNLSTPDPASITATASDTGTGIAFLNFEQCSETSPTCASDTWTPLGVDTTAPYGVSWPIPSDGTRLLRVRAQDEAGLQTAELVLVTVDRTRPAGSLTAPAGGADLRGTNVGLTATASDAAPGTVNTVTFQRSPAGAGTWSDVAVDSSAPYTASFDTTAVADGLYDLRVFTTDMAGNAESTPTTIQVRVDNTDPTGTITAPLDAADLRGTVALTSNSADSGSGVATVVFQRSPAGAGTWTNQAASWNTTLQTDGLYDLRVVTTDNAGNTFSSAPITVRVDNTDPTGTVTAPLGGANVRGTIALASDSADTGSGVATTQFQRSPAGSGIWTNQAASWNTTLQADGLYDLRVVTTDNAGNTFTSGQVTVRVDNTAPTGSITAPANGAEIGVSPVALTSNSADSGSGLATVVFERSPAGAGSWSPTPASWDTASGPNAVADGDYDLRVKTTDNAGNSFTSAVITVKVDHTAPTTSASVAPGSPSNAPITVTFSASDGTGSGVSATSYSIDGGSIQLGNSAIVAAPGDHSNDGSHVVQYFSTDDVGNVETPKTVTVVIDTTAPSGAPGDPGTFLRGIANLTYSTGAGDVSSVQFQFSPAGAGAWSNIGAADISPPYDAAWNTVLVADGPYDLRAVVTDTTGNVANELLPGLPKTVDNTAPSGSVTSPAAASFVSGTVNVNANASDGAVPPASGVSAVRFEIKPSGSGSFSVFGTQNTPVVGSTYQQSLVTSGFPDGPADLRVVVTDVAGNETTSAATTVTFDNDAPVITLNDPGAAVSGTITLGVTTSADTAQVVFERSPAGAGTWTTIATDSTPGDGFTAAFATSALADGLYDLRARATDVGGNPGTSGTRTTRLDNTQPTGSITAPSAGAIVGGPAVQLTAAGADSGSGVVSVAFEVKAFGAGSFTSVGNDTAAPYTANWDSTTAPDGDAEIRAIVTDAAGNVHTTAIVIVTVDSTGPAVTLTDPGAVLSGTVGLTASTSGGATRVSFGVSPAGSGTWTEIASDTSSPFAADIDTSALADGLYDLRAIGYDSLGNASTPSVRANVRFDNTAPSLVSSDPADGSVSTSANQILLTGSEPVTAPGALLDGVAAPAPSVSGNELTFATGSLAEGLHVLSGELVDASGNRTPFRVAITIESTPQADRPPVEKSASPTATTTLVAAGQLATVQLPASAWPAIPGPKDFLVLHVDPILPSAGLASRLAAGSSVIEVTARWALAGTNVHDFDDVLEVLLPAAAGTNGAPVTSQDGTTWRTLASVNGTTLPVGRADGFYRDSAGVHVLTRHLSYFAFFGDDQPPTPPRDVAGVVAEDGLTLRWLPGTDDSGQLGKVVLLVNGEPYATFDPTQYEVKLGAFTAGDTRVFSFLQYDAAGNVSEPSQALRAVPSVVGLDADAAAAKLAAAGFALGKVTRTVDPTVAPGTVVGPTKLLVAAVGSSIDVVAAADSSQTQFVFRIANDKVVKVKVGKPASIPVRVVSTRPASGTATLATATGRRLYTWRFQVKAGATITKLRLPSQVRRPGYYRLIWSARSGSASARKAVRIRFVGPALEQLRTRPHRVEVVLAVDTSRGAHTISSSADRVVSHATPERTFALLSAADRSVSVVVVDVDRFGIQFLRDVRTVFPTVRAIALSDRRVRWPAIKRAGAFSVLPRSATHEQLGRTIAVAGGR